MSKYRIIEHEGALIGKFYTVEVNFLHFFWVIIAGGECCATIEEAERKIMTHQDASNPKVVKEYNQ